MNYFITGLPRSRTAWLANFLTYDGSFCFHELCRKTTNVHEMKLLLSYPKYKHVGTSDCALSYYFDKLIEMLDEWKLIVIDRNLDDAINSLDKIGLKTKESIEKVLEAHNRNKYMMKKHEHLLIPFEALNKQIACEKIWEYCTGTKMDKVRFDELNILDIEVNMKKYMQTIRAEEISELMEV